jgi:hypothetical protein
MALAARTTRPTLAQATRPQPNRRSDRLVARVRSSSSYEAEEADAEVVEVAEEGEAAAAETAEAAETAAAMAEPVVVPKKKKKKKVRVHHAPPGVPRRACRGPAQPCFGTPPAFRSSTSPHVSWARDAGVYRPSRVCRGRRL